MGTSRIADLAVTGAKVANGTLRLANLAVWSAAGGTGGQTVSANNCLLFNFGDISAALPTDLVAGVNSGASFPLPMGLVPYGVITNTSGHLLAGYCNLTPTAIPVLLGSALTFYGIR